MRLLISIAVVLALAGCSSCQPASAPSDQQIYLQLVEAGCMAADPEGGVQAVAMDHAVGDHAWMNCLYGEGTIQSCKVPCSK